MIENIKLSTIQFALNIKTIVRSISNIFLLLFIPTILIIVPIMLFPLRFSFGLLLLSTSFLIPMIVYSFVSSNYKSSTLYQNNNLTRSNKWAFNISTILTMFLVTYLLLFYLIIMLMILNELSILTMQFGFAQESTDYYTIYSMNWVYVLYTTFTCIMVAYALCYFINSFSESQKTFYIVIVALFAITVIFGGMLNEYFMVMVDATGYDQVYAAFPGSSLFPSYMFYVSMILPFFSQGQMFAIVGETITHNADGLFANYGVNFDYYSPWVWQKHSVISELGLTNAAGWRWNICWLLPYMHATLWFGSGVAIKVGKILV